MRLHGFAVLFTVHVASFAVACGDDEAETSPPTSTSSGAGGDGDVLDPHDQGLALDVAEREIRVVREPVLAVAVHVDVIERGEDALLEVVAERARVLGVLRHVLLAQLARLAQAHDARNVQGPRAHAPFVPAAVDLGGVCITPVERDFERITKDHVVQMFDEVMLPSDAFVTLVEHLSVKGY